MEPLSAEQQTAQEDPHFNLVWFVEFHFLSGVIRCSTMNLNYTWGGYEWMGLGDIGDISPLNERLGVASESITFTISLPRTEWLALSAGAVEEYRGRDAKLHHCPLDENFRMVGTPRRAWSGTMDQMQPGVTVEKSGGTGQPLQSTGSIALVCETSNNGVRRRSSLRVNAAQHKQKHPTDTGLDRMTRLIGNQFPWLSVRFQQR